MLVEKKAEMESQSLLAKARDEPVVHVERHEIWKRGHLRKIKEYLEKVYFTGSCRHIDEGYRKGRVPWTHTGVREFGRLDEGIWEAVFLVQHTLHRQFACPTLQSRHSGSDSDPFKDILEVGKKCILHVEGVLEEGRQIVALDRVMTGRYVRYRELDDGIVKVIVHDAMEPSVELPEQFREMERVSDVVQTFVSWMKWLVDIDEKPFKSEVCGYYVLQYIRNTIKFVQATIGSLEDDIKQMKTPTIDSFFERKITEISEKDSHVQMDEARDESKKEQMSLVLRFIDKDGCIHERFFGLLHVKDTASLTLKSGIFLMLSQYNLDIMFIRGQGYDGASNMRGEWNGFQALVSRECPYAYYVHCFAHRLQLSLVAASKEVYHVHHFFEKLNFTIVNIVSASCKCNDQLRDAHASTMAFLLAIGDLESGKGLNQLGSLQRAGDTRWTSHFKSIYSMIKMFSATYEVLLTIKSDGNTHSQRGEASSVYETMTFFTLFIMHLMREVLDITSCLCNALQLQSQDILNAMSLVSTSKSLLQKLRDDGWSKLVEKHFDQNFRAMLMVDENKKIKHVSFDIQVSTATTERSFSRMNIVKSALHNKMKDDFLSDYLVVNIE
ncbi:hypothetical protein QQ045_010243 [Rhodiola kirilowii]